MKRYAIVYLQLALLSNRTLCGFPSEFSNAKYNSLVDNEIISEEEMMANRKTGYPESEEAIWRTADDENDDGISKDDVSSFVSSSNNGVSSYSYSSSSSNGPSIVNGIDTSKLPPNYHNVTTSTKIINGRPVTVNVTIDKKTDPKTGEVSVSVSESSSSSSSSSIGKANVCESSKQCRTGYFCKSSWINSCQQCSNINQRCTQNEECCGNGTAHALCVNGICQAGYRKGDAGTLCQKTTDCASSMCCARSFLKRVGICKPLAKQGEKCASSSSSSSARQIFKPGTCPCIRGLICSSGSFTERFFGGSMNSFFSGNTCRVPRRISPRSRWSWWRRRRRRNTFDMDDPFER